MKWFLVASTCALVMTSAAAASPPDDDSNSDKDKLTLPLEGKIAGPDWQVTPNGDEMAREYPIAASAMDLAGQASVTCTVDTAGRLKDCHIDNEQPAGFGFGAAALRLAAYFQMKPAMLDERPVEGKVTVPIRFQMGSHPAPLKPEVIPPPTSPEALIAARDVVVAQDAGAGLRAMAEPFLRRIAAQVQFGGDATNGLRVVDAYRAALDDTITEELERRAKVMASMMTADQLRSTVAYLRSPSGAAFVQIQAKFNDPEQSDIFQRMVQDAKARICQQQTC